MCLFYVTEKFIVSEINYKNYDKFSSLDRVEMPQSCGVKGNDIYETIKTITRN